VQNLALYNFANFNLFKVAFLIFDFCMCPFVQLDVGCNVTLAQSCLHTIALIDALCRFQRSFLLKTKESKSMSISLWRI
jgi:hypothetical protein